MDYEWDEAKRLSNIEKHGFDFLRASEVLEGDTLIIPDNRQGEPRKIAIGLWHTGLTVAVVYTLRARRYRIISIRRARYAERKAYREAFNRGT